MTEISDQYDDMGKLYLNSQETVYNVRDIWGRERIDAYVGSYGGKIVMDAGCGNGLDTEGLLKKGAKSVLAFDPSEVMLDDARKAINNGLISFAKGTFEEIPFGDASADVMIGVFALHYVADLDAGYKEISRVMKQGGKIAFVCTHPYDMTLQKQSAFKGQEVVTMWIYNNTVPVKQPSHTMAEYFSPYFLSQFSLDILEEFYPTDTEGNALRDPTLIAFCATKK